MSDRPRHVLDGELTVALPPEKAFPLFTARGEQLWVPGWSPQFTARTDDDTAIGTVWRTSADGRETTWIVVESNPPVSAAYARVTPGHSATTVRVRLEPSGEGSRVRVRYDITSLDESADPLLEQFAAEYDEMLREWHRLIADALPRIVAAEPEAVSTTPADGIRLQDDVEGVDWTAVEELFALTDLGGRKGDKLRRAFLASPVVCFAFDGERLVGCARAITDHEYHAVVYDVAVHPELQGTGVGKRLVQRALERLPVWRVMLIADDGVQGFYRRVGFEPYPGAMAKLDWDALYDPA